MAAIHWGYYLNVLFSTEKRSALPKTVTHVLRDIVGGGVKHSGRYGQDVAGEMNFDVRSGD